MSIYYIPPTIHLEAYFILLPPSATSTGWVLSRSQAWPNCSNRLWGVMGLLWILTEQ